ncbi:hypothetical protein K457DRAFT_14196 [Linnemannia elongata AG-77]|uniref:F-box domain-containing protein n=1 Tax=Linnemannia elongata AG-77 TaxID=1314771 RepID=A0A197KD89_9FUNG|nr:hypothetical protein K457DRAFT_14196 [Linnemannia elongata AG-77]
MEDLPTLSPLQPNDDAGYNNNDSSLVMKRLEILSLDYTSTTNLFITQLVDSCSRLKTLEIHADERSDTRLVDNLHINCQNFKYLTLSTAGAFHLVEVLIRYSSVFGLSIWTQRAICQNFWPR